MDQQPQQPQPPNEWPPPAGPPTVLSPGQPGPPPANEPPSPAPGLPARGGDPAGFGPPGLPGSPGGFPASPALANPAGWSVPGPATTSMAPVSSSALGRTRAGRGGVVSGFMALVFIGVFGNRWVIDAALDRLRGDRWPQAFISTNFFAHWNVRPADSGARGVLIEAFWADLTGGLAVQRSSLGDERWLHWIANYLRIGLLVVAIALVVSIVLSGHRGNLLARWIAAWGGVFLASTLVGALTSVAFYAVSDANSFSPTLDLMLGAAHGGAWAALAGLPISLFGAALSKPK